MSGNDIFISYSREDRTSARQFAECFAREGFSVWWDAVLRSGQTFDEIIEQELRAAKAVVVLWSPRSVRSRWVRAEATLADRSNKLVPIIIEPCDLPIIFELTHASELAQWAGDTSDSRWQTLVSDLRRMVGTIQQAAPEAPAVDPVPAKAASVPEAPSTTATPSSEANAKSRRPNAEEIMRALDRLGNAQESKLSEPTPEEKQQAEFYRRSDEFRANEREQLHCLLRLDGEDQETRFVVSTEGLRIGRAAPADVIVSGLGVSRQHCMVEMAADQVRVTDLNSTNGTFIDNKRIERSANLEVGSVLRVGNVSFEHVLRTHEELDPDFDPAAIVDDDIPRSAARH
ncbi:TIR domain-containing protein [Sphingomonas sp. RB56-2]|uniref:TIR domain-containing protein n=1 Tax=Sphingomonas brevis TaxID=2908206 RepID=A0ABT0S9I3_9SPHN|nr:TIR domain-containing protein [Sphingomonas brevis]